MSQVSKTCGRVEGVLVAKCHYMWCRQHKACIERPGVVVKMFKRTGAGPSPFTGRKRGKVKATAG